GGGGAGPAGGGPVVGGAASGGAVQHEVDVDGSGGGVVGAQGVAAHPRARLLGQFHEGGVPAHHVAAGGGPGQYGLALPRAGEEQFHLPVGAVEGEVGQVGAAEGDAGHVRAQAPGRDGSDQADGKLTCHGCLPEGSEKERGAG